jgi:hypothetical protein
MMLLMVKDKAAVPAMGAVAALVIYRNSFAEFGREGAVFGRAYYR